MKSTMQSAVGRKKEKDRRSFGRFSFCRDILAAEIIPFSTVGTAPMGSLKAYFSQTYAL